MAPLPLKIVLDRGAVTCKVKLDTKHTVAKAHEIVREKIHVPDGGKDYALFLRSADDDMSGVWLEQHRTLDYYMLRDGDSLDYICRNRILRIKMLDGAVKALQVDEVQPVGRLLMTICSRLGITNYDEYGLCRDATSEPADTKATKEATATLTLKRKAQPKERDAKLEELSKILKTDDHEEWLDQHRTLREQSVGTTETLLLKRRLFYSDRNVDARDPVQLNLLYVQTRNAILSGRHLVTEQQAAECKVRWINIRDVHRRIIRKSLNCLPDRPMKAYKYENELSFMRSYYKDVIIPPAEPDSDDDDEEYKTNQIDVLCEDNVEQDIPEITYSEDEKPIKKVRTKKRKYKKRKDSSYNDDEKPATSFSETQNLEFDPTDSVDAFLLSIGATLKTFSPYHLNIAKSKIFSVVQEHDLKQIVEKDQRDLAEVKVSASDSIY